MLILRVALFAVLVVWAIQVPLVVYIFVAALSDRKRYRR